MFASPVEGGDAKLWNSQLCIFHDSGSLRRTRIRRREVGRWEIARMGEGGVRGRIKTGGGGILSKIH